MYLLENIVLVVQIVLIYLFGHNAGTIAIQTRFSKQKPWQALNMVINIDIQPDLTTHKIHFIIKIHCNS